MSTEQWTPDDLRRPGGMALHLQQRQRQMQPIADDLRRLARQLKADLKEDGKLYGDLPLQDKVRAWRTAQPIFEAADKVEEALTELVTLAKRYEKNYERIPEQRSEKEIEKRRAKELKRSGGQLPANVHAISSASGKDDGGDFMGIVSRGA